MELDQYLRRTDLLDCTGQVSHVLVLDLDGTVRIEFSNGRRARIDPCHRVNLTPGVAVGAALMDAAVGFASVG
ncbi:MAG: hypothetical protein JJU45_14165 [Acidimicrobiia bacterium]|nr:hypothetical protein [Acidimicrobiia bacterium]